MSKELTDLVGVDDSLLDGLDEYDIEFDCFNDLDDWILKLGEFVGDTDTIVVVVYVNKDVNDEDIEKLGHVDIVDEIDIKLDKELVTLFVFVLYNVLDNIGVRVFDFVYIFDTVVVDDNVDVFDISPDFVGDPDTVDVFDIVVVDETVLVPNTLSEYIVDLVGVFDTVPDRVLVEEDDWVSDLFDDTEVDGDAVILLDEELELVCVFVINDVLVLIGDDDLDADPEEVFEGLTDFVCKDVVELVFDDEIELVCVDDIDDVFEGAGDLVVVFVIIWQRLGAGDCVVVLLEVVDCVGKGLADDVLEFNADGVVAIVLNGVYVNIDDLVFNKEIRDE